MRFCLDPFPLVNGTDRIKMKEILPGMHTGIGTAAAIDLYRRLHQMGKRVLNDWLNACRIRLTLPACIVSAIVGDLKKVTQFIYFAAKLK